MTIPREVGQLALDNLESLVAYIQGGEPDLVMQVPAIEALRVALAAKEPEPVGNTLTFMTRAIFNIVADHQEINGGYFIADGDVAAFVDRLAKVINSTFEPLKHKGSVPPQREWQGLTEKEHEQIAIDCGCASADWVFYGAAVERKVKEKNT